MKRERKAKILATLGPATANETMIARLHAAGVDVFRLNFSHGAHADHAKTVATIRAVEKKAGRPIGILMDLQGPKLRVGKLPGGKLTLKDGAKVELIEEKETAKSGVIPIPHAEIFAALEDGAEILLDDGRLRLRVEKHKGKTIAAQVLVGGELSNNKGINLPGTVLPLSPVTAKDRSDLNFGLDQGVDWVALSFVQKPEDLAEARKLIGKRAALMAKIEKPSAIEHLGEIIDASDAVMIARGDLGVELPPEEVPGRQKEIVRACRLAGKPVVVATQMLDSMIESPTPTRAEASDVATAIYDGADAVMLSAETAVGRFPIETVTIMNRIIRRTESEDIYQRLIHALKPEPEATAADAISAACAQVAHTVKAAAIVSYTTSGSTALRTARERPDVPIMVLTSNLNTARRLSVLWGAHCVHTADVDSFREMVAKACRIAVKEDFATSGAKLVITAGVPFGTPGATNILRIAWIGEG